MAASFLYGVATYFYYEKVRRMVRTAMHQTSLSCADRFKNKVKIMLLLNTEAVFKERCCFLTKYALEAVQK